MVHFGKELQTMEVKPKTQSHALCRVGAPKPSSLRLAPASSRHIISPPENPGMVQAGKDLPVCVSSIQEQCCQWANTNPS